MAEDKNETEMQKQPKNVQANFNIQPEFRGESDFSSSYLVILSYILVIITFPFSLCCCIKIVGDDERAVIFRLGRIAGDGAKGPGLFFILPCIDTIVKIDMRTITLEVPSQKILTRDLVSVTVDAIVSYRVSDPVLSAKRFPDVQNLTRLLVVATLRNTLGTHTLAEFLHEKENIANHMQEILDATTQDWTN